MELQNKVALITGSTSGIGRATALRMAAAGAEVVVTGRDAARGHAVVEDIAAAGGAARFVEADLSAPRAVDLLVREAGDVDVLVHNAVHPVAGPALDQDVESFEASFAVNVRVPYFLTQQLVPTMIEKGAGSIVNVASLSAHVALPGLSVYSAAKAALASLTRTWAAEFGGHGVRVNTVSPGITGTEAAIDSLGHDMVGSLAGTALLRRVADPREIAEAITFLASDASSYLTGTVLHVDGGRSVA